MYYSMFFIARSIVDRLCIIGSHTQHPVERQLSKMVRCTILLVAKYPRSLTGSNYCSPIIRQFQNGIAPFFSFLFHAKLSTQFPYNCNYHMSTLVITTYRPVRDWFRIGLVSLGLDNVDLLYSRFGHTAVEQAFCVDN